MEKMLGKIEKASFGVGGYNEAMIGLFLTLKFGDSTGCNTDKCAWDYKTIKHTKYCKWTEEDRSQQYVEIMRYLSELLSDAKVKKVDQLAGIPIEATFEDRTLVEFRILTEVL